MPLANRERNDVLSVDEVTLPKQEDVPHAEIDGLVRGFTKIKSQRIRNEVMALISELTREDRRK